MERQIKSTIKIIPENNGFKVEYDMTTFYKKEGNMFSCFIPSLDITFSTKENEDIIEISKCMVDSFLDYWIKGHNFTSFSIEIKKLGFKVDKEPTVMFALRNNKKVKADFNANININDDTYNNNIAISGNRIAA